MDKSAAGVTLRVAAPLAEPKVAVIVVDPTDAPVASPVPEIFAALVEEVQVTAAWCRQQW